LGQAPAHPKEAMMSIQSLQQTGPPGVGFSATPRQRPDC
jgi:hypothetical protein